VICKPSNVLLDANGNPRVTDFGLAKRIEADSELTGTGEILGTPSYMPPEQARGETESVGKCSDIYSLGAVFYCILTGRPPFQAATIVETLRQVQEAEPVKPRRLNPTTPRDLETICLKCLEKEPNKRYPSADAVAIELQRFQQDKPILARPISKLSRAWRYFKRNKVTSLMGVALVLALLYPLIIGIGLTVYEFRGLIWDSSQPGSSVGYLDAHERLVFPGVAVERAFEMQDALEWNFEAAPVFRFISGVYDDGEFREGGRVYVWVEFEKNGEIQKYFEHMYDLKVAPGTNITQEVTFAWMRGKRGEGGMENWRSHSIHREMEVDYRQESSIELESPLAQSSRTSIFESESNSGFESSGNVTVDVWSDPETLRDYYVAMLNREDLTAREKDVIADAIQQEEENPTAPGTAYLFGSTARPLLSTGANLCLYHFEEKDFSIDLDLLLEENGLPQRNEPGRYEIRIMCRLLTDNEFKELRDQERDGPILSIPSKRAFDRLRAE